LSICTLDLIPLVTFLQSSNLCPNITKRQEQIQNIYLGLREVQTHRLNRSEVK
jgi:hypothetical protein